MTVIPPDNQASQKATRPHLHTIKEPKQLRIRMSNFADLLCNSQPVGPCVRKWRQASMLCFCAARIWLLITLGLFALFPFPEKWKPGGSQPTAPQHVQAGLQHRCECHTMLTCTLEARLRLEDHEDSL